MDIYGCSTSWSMNRPNELPDSSFSPWPGTMNVAPPCEAAPVDTHPLPSPACSPWPPAGLPWGSAPAPPCQGAPVDGHVMPSPSCSPWSPAGLSWGSPAPPPLVHFTAHTPQVPHATVMHCKRKVDIEPVIPAKQFITEEKMAAHLSGLHISHEYREHGDCPPPSPAAPPPPHAWLRGARTIVLADEIKRLQQEPLLPPSLLQRLEKPCTSLMVWQPREHVIPEDGEEEGGGRGSRRAGAPVAEHAQLDTDVEM